MQRVTLTSISDFLALRIDQAIDVRSPSEYAEDHLPGAINLPVLDDAERARVGTVYVRESRFLARRMGAALVARNAAAHLEGALADKPASYRPLVYCWRGGQRSGSFATILAQIGWQVAILDGGWKTWRRLVQAALYDAPFPAPVLVLDGNTGTAKTDLLARVAARGGQVIDLEGLARHRGSLFGLAPGDRQPAQKAFESALALAMARLNPARPVLIEAESNRIGDLRLPPTLWRALQEAPRIEIDAPLSARTDWLIEAYADVVTDRAELDARIQALAPYQPREVIADWRGMAAAGDLRGLAGQLIQRHYDPRYQKTSLRQAPPQAVLRTDRLDEAGRDALAAQLAARLG